jgi:hypothetical protein
MATGSLDMILTPGRWGQTVPDGVTWCADNGCYGAGYPGDEAWWAWLSSFPPADITRCAFAVAPDVVGDAAATLARSGPWLPRMRGLGYPAALAAQNGLEDLDVPWAAFDVLFVGGDTGWKLGPAARDLIARALARGKRVHMGRVNSEKRYRYALALGCHSADGTYLAYGPHLNLPAVLAWTRNVDQGMLT